MMIQYILWTGVQMIIGISIGFMGLRGVKRIEKRQLERMNEEMRPSD